jgi:hypothetical protein
LKILVLEREKNNEHNRDYPTANLSHWELPHRGDITLQTKKNSLLVNKAAGFDEVTQFFL